MHRRRGERKTERLITPFYKHLTLKKGLSEATASEHALDQVGMELVAPEEELVGDNIILMAEFILGVFAERIMPALKLFGLIDFGFDESRDDYFVRQGVGITWFSVSALGTKLFGALAQSER